MKKANFVQMAWVVDDLDRAMDFWIREYGAGPFFRLDDGRFDVFEFRGKPVVEHFSAAVAQTGTLQVELVCLNGGRSSLFNVPKNPAGATLHHFGGIFDDFEGALADYRAQGVEVLGQGWLGDIRFAFADTTATVGCYTEILTGHNLDQRLDGIAKAAREWDGKSNPVRPFASMVH